ncbi:helix-turn-helix transcriptional regulator [bacterium]|nr:helix-turn-helix transcriptional regulator [bacterium]
MTGSTGLRSRIVADLEAGREFTADEVVEQFGVSIRHAHRTLSGLVDSGRVVWRPVDWIGPSNHGSGPRARSYFLAPTWPVRT